MFLKANAASLRALAGGTQHEVRYVGQDSIITNDGVRLPAPPKERSSNTEIQLRGASDAAGLWLAHHNKKIHQSCWAKWSKQRSFRAIPNAFTPYFYTNGYYSTGYKI